MDNWQNDYIRRIKTASDLEADKRDSIEELGDIFFKIALQKHILDKKITGTATFEEPDAKEIYSIIKDDPSYNTTIKFNGSYFTFGDYKNQISCYELQDCLRSKYAAYLPPLQMAMALTIIFATGAIVLWGIYIVFKWFFLLIFA